MASVQIYRYDQTKHKYGKVGGAYRYEVGCKRLFVRSISLFWAKLLSLTHSLTRNPGC